LANALQIGGYAIKHWADAMRKPGMVLRRELLEALPDQRDVLMPPSCNNRFVMSDSVSNISNFRKVSMYFFHVLAAGQTFLGNGVQSLCS